MPYYLSYRSEEDSSLNGIEFEVSDDVTVSKFLEVFAAFLRANDFPLEYDDGLIVAKEGAIVFDTEDELEVYVSQRKSEGFTINFDAGDTVLKLLDK